VSVLALVLTVLAAAAPAPTLADIEDEVMCVSCGIPLFIAESPQADAQRAFIRERIAAGDDKEEIKDALVAEYGRTVLAVPEDDGFALAAWLVPVLALAGVAALLAFALPRWRRRAPGPSPAPALGGPRAARPDELERLAADLASRDP
jgi:cytochrome c-type biogenesis protein CcmH